MRGAGRVNIKDIKKKQTGFALNPQFLKHSVKGVFFKFNTLFELLTFQIIY